MFVFAAVKMITAHSEVVVMLIFNVYMERTVLLHATCD